MKAWARRAEAEAAAAAAAAAAQSSSPTENTRERNGRTERECRGPGSTGEQKAGRKQKVPAHRGLV
jgi:hypothetical protein